MSAPVASTRLAPDGDMLEDGFSSKIVFATDRDIALWEITTKPPGVDGGDPIDLTNMHNTEWRTMAAKRLKTLTAGSIKFAYDPTLFKALKNLINVETTITQLFSDGSTIAYFGYLKSAEFDDLQEGVLPQGTATIIPTNREPSTGIEYGPTVTATTGT